MSGAATRVFLGAGTFSLAAGGAAFGYRQNLVRVRRDELLREELAAEEQLRKARARLADLDRAHAAERRRESEMIAVADTLWTDRLARYERSAAEMAATLVAAPEALGVLEGLRHHMQFLSSLLPSFARFDFQAHRMQGLLVLLRDAKAIGPHRAAPDLLAQFGRDPLINAVATNVATHANTGDVASSMDELSGSFDYCIQQLNEAVQAAHVARAAVAATPPPAPSLLTHATGLVARQLRLTTAPPPAEAAKAAREQLQREQEDQRRLHTHADVRSAISFSDSMLTALGPSSAAKKSPTTSTTAANSDNATSSGRAPTDALATTTTDAAVQAASQQLRLWRDAAVSFLLQQQAQQALEAYALCLVDSLTQTREDGIPPEIADNAAADQ